MKSPSPGPSQDQASDNPKSAEESRIRSAEALASSFVWQQQEIPFDHPESCCRFRLDGSKVVVATPAALRKFGEGAIRHVLEELQRQAVEHDGLDYLQVFEDCEGNRLWVIEDRGGPAITALLPEDY